MILWSHLGLNQSMQTLKEISEFLSLHVVRANNASNKIIQIKMDWGEGTRISQTNALLRTCLRKWGVTKARLVLRRWPRLNSPHHRNWFFLMPLFLAGAFLKENPQTANILNRFFHLYSWMCNEAVQVKIQVKCRMYYSSGGSLETWTADLSFISRFLPLLMDTVDAGLEMLLQPHTQKL